MGSNLPHHVDTISQDRWKAAMVDWIGSLRFTHAVTLAWSRSVSAERARADLRDLMHRVDRRLLKSHFAKVPSPHRTEAMFVFEGFSNHHVHVHSLWRAPPGKAFQLGRLFPAARGGVWNEVVESGSYDVTTCNQHGRDDEIVGYMLKEQHRFADANQVFWGSDFHRAN